MRIPRLKLYQLIILALGAVLTIAGLIYTIVKYPGLPAEIPTHYNFAGEIDGYGGKGAIWVLEGVNLGIFIMMTAFIFFPAVIQNPSVTWRVDPMKRHILGAETISLLLEMSLLMVAFFDFMIYSTINTIAIGMWPTIVFVLLIFGTSIFRLIHMYRLTRIKKQPWER